MPDAQAAFEYAVGHGARAVREPFVSEDEHGRVELASIATYGEVVHTFVARSAYEGPFLPGYRSLATNGAAGAGYGLLALDHVVGNVELGKMNEWVEFYERVLGFENIIHFTEENITEYSALMSKVMADGERKIKFPINEPAEGRRKSQIQEYLDFNDGPGVQHVALQTSDIVRTVETLREHGVLLLKTPESYYGDLPDRVGEIEEDFADLERLGILADRDEDGYCCSCSRRPHMTADALLRGNRAPRRDRLRRGQFQGLRGDRARAGAPRQPLARVQRVSWSAAAASASCSTSL